MQKFSQHLKEDKSASILKLSMAYRMLIKAYDRKDMSLMKIAKARVNQYEKELGVKIGPL